MQQTISSHCLLNSVVCYLKSEDNLIWIPWYVITSFSPIVFSSVCFEAFLIRCVWLWIFSVSHQSLNFLDVQIIFQRIWEPYHISSDIFSAPFHLHSSSGAPVL